jgi:thiol:disulfide interchange protein DsbA
MTKADTKVRTARTTILGFVTLIAVLLLGTVLYVSTDIGAGEITAGKDYRVVDNARPRRAGDPIEVLEFFSYACIHCKNFDPAADEWAAEQPDDVSFRRVPATFSPLWALLSQSYLTFESAGVLEQNHTRMFRAIHDTGREFRDLQAVADYVDGRGISAEDFMREFNSPAVREAMRDADRAQRAYLISSTPQLVVAGKYVVGMEGGQRRALQVLDHLIAQERAGESTPAN